MFDNTLLCDEVWIQEPKEGQADTRYYLKSNRMDDNQNPVMLKPVGNKLYQLTRAFHLYNFAPNQVDYHQPCTYMIAGLLEQTGQLKLTFHMIQQIWD